jgi:protein-S-isoprenylcysteine O-methyltransferase Ste14
LPFACSVGLLVPALIAGRVFWFARQWGDLAYVILTIGMWLTATAFVDVTAREVERDLPRLLITLGLIFSVPVSVADRNYGPASSLPDALSIFGLSICLLAAGLGIAARLFLGKFYAPHPRTDQNHQLVTGGPYRWIRHPLYSAALLWGIGWPLLIRSLLGALLMVGFEVPFLLLRIREEENALSETFGEDYAEYKERTWKLIPFVY